MHFEILVEDQSGKKALKFLLPKMIGNEDTFKVFSFKGLGRIPKNLAGQPDPRARKLLAQLPAMLRGYGRTFAAGHSAAVIVVCDLDNKCLKAFRDELLDMLRAISPQPETRFCLAIEEGEAWLLGDLPAIFHSYPAARRTVLENYVNDSICGTWECLADAIYAGGANTLRNKGWQAVGKEKSTWADRIAPVMDVENNASPSFRYFREKIRLLASADGVST